MLLLAGVEIGRVLAERYALVRPLAEGAMATVWVAEDRVSGGEVAIKAISLDAAGWRTEVRDRFMKEARLLALAQHEHLVGVRDVGETEDGFLYLVLDLLDGETLADRIAHDPPLDWKEAGSISLAITRGVAALHRAGIVHRDLKPANIVLHRADGGTVPKIIDLGISKVRAAAADPELCATLTATGQVLGTPQYMSYEQALGDPDVDARSDVWALGVILYEMLGRRRPFEAPNANAVLAAIRRKDAPALAEVARDVPGALAKLVDRCLLTDRAERFKDAGEMAEALQTALCSAAADPTPAEPPPPETKKPASAAAPKPSPAPISASIAETPTPQRSRAVTGIVLMAGVALLGGTIATFLTRDPAPTPQVAPTKATSAAAPTPEEPDHRTKSASSPTQTPVATSPAADVRPVVQATSAAASSASVPSTRPAVTTTRGGTKPLTQVNEAGF
ncbi:serine/threonine-protein kinase [Polyangium sp. 15x6]|uniref:serine/threonine-protein kinase n=1 Tax=Polyangium sp. 15x6 TaxID=3042687 RepID=UPI00249BE1C3|nr:serine/threonine-protein kinase [Polyangium sp. 15x6]MDI3286313.1 protein kinase [Polyangium sp. 15x6]